MDQKCDFGRNSKKIGILGAAGMIGQSLDRILQQKRIAVLKGSRSFENGPDTRRVTTDDLDSLKRFVDACDIIINCAGPSLITTHEILPVVMKEGKDYVDAFGWRKEQQNLDLGKSRIILNAGSVPGILGILICNMYQAETQEMKVWSGGREGGSIGSVGDIILSSINGYANSNCYMEDFRVVKSQERKMESFAWVKEQEEQISTQLILTDEIEKVAKHLGIRKIQNYTIWADDRMKRTMMYGCMEALRLTDGEERTGLFSAVQSRIEQLNKGKQPWFTIVIEAVEADGKNVLKLYTKESSKLTAAMLAYMAEILIRQEIAGGVYWPFELADAGDVLRLIQNIGICVDISGEL